MVKERERGTVEQLLMTPAGTAEIIIAKITPLFMFLMLMVIAAMAMIRFVFNMPFCELAVGVFRSGAVRALRYWAEDLHCHLHTNRTAIVTDQLLR